MKMNANPCKTVSEFEPLLNVREVAKLFGVNHSTLLRMARSGHLPGVKIGKLWRFRVSELNSWKTSGMIAKTERSR
jgi:excisionase family DNA binding protein